MGNKLDPQKLSELLQDPGLASSSRSSVLVFWSVTCAPCLEKLKDLPDLRREGRVVYPINTDPETAIAGAKKLLEAALPGQKFLRDRDQVLVTQLEIDYLPTHVFLNPEGVIEKIEIGKK